jgi:hypothetical protein
MVLSTGPILDSIGGARRRADKSPATRSSIAYHHQAVGAGVG